MSALFFRSNKSWSGLEDALLRKLVSEGNGVLDISRRLNRTTRAIRRHTEILKISWKTSARSSRMQPCLNSERSPYVRWKVEDDSRVREMIMAGYSEIVISQELGRTPSAIRKRAHRLKLSLKISDVQPS